MEYITWSIGLLILRISGQKECSIFTESIIDHSKPVIWAFRFEILLLHLSPPVSLCDYWHNFIGRIVDHSEWLSLSVHWVFKFI